MGVVVDDLALAIVHMGAGFALCFVMMKVVPFFMRSWWPNRAKKMDDMEWQDETNRAFTVMMADQLQSARSKAYLASLVGRVPEGFDPAIWESFSIAARVEKHVLEQAEAEGLVAADVTEKIFAPEPPSAYVREVVSEETAEPSNIRRLPTGRILPKRVSNGG